MEAPTDSLHRSRYRIVIAGLILAAHLAVGLNMFPVSPILLLIIQDLSINSATAGCWWPCPCWLRPFSGCPVDS